MGQRDRMFKVLVVGDATVGKTSLVQRYANDSFNRHYKSTVGGEPWRSRGFPGLLRVPCGFPAGSLRLPRGPAPAPARCASRAPLRAPPCPERSAPRIPSPGGTRRSPLLLPGPWDWEFGMGTAAHHRWLMGHQFAGSLS